MIFVGFSPDEAVGLCGLRRLRPRRLAGWAICCVECHGVSFSGPDGLSASVSSLRVPCRDVAMLAIVVAGVRCVLRVLVSDACWFQVAGVWVWSVGLCVFSQSVGSEHCVMAKQALKRSDFNETYSVHSSVKHALKSKLFSKDVQARRAAEKLLKYLESDRSIYGRQCQMIRMMEKGATIAQLRKGLNCSRRTVFRYFLDLESADVDITLEGEHYSVAKGLLSLI